MCTCQPSCGQRDHLYGVLQCSADWTATPLARARVLRRKSGGPAGVAKTSHEGARVPATQHPRGPHRHRCQASWDPYSRSWSGAAEHLGRRDHVITAAGPLPEELRQAVEAINASR
jgi:hypothetical protein